MKAVSDPFARTTKAAGRAFTRIGSVLGFDTNPHLALYKKLKASDFDTILGAYGPEATVDYIHEMEAKLLTGR